MGFKGANALLSPKLHSLSITQSVVGIPIKRLWGTNRVQADLLWAGDFQSVAQQAAGGGKGFGGKNATQWDYKTAMQGALCAGPISAILSIWASNGRLTLQTYSEDYTIPSGGGSYAVSNATKFNGDLGVSQAQSYSVVANDYGSPGPITYSGTQQAPMAPTAGTPTRGEYSQSSGTYTFAAADGGTTVTITYTYNLYVLEEQEDYLIPTSSPYEVTVQYANGSGSSSSIYESDMGVIFVDTGISLTKGSGEGQYTEDGNGNYFFNSADHGRPVAISYTWNNAAFTTDPTSTLELTVINGTQGQSSWSYMESRHASMAIGYSGIATVATPALDCGSSTSIPQFNYEIAGPLIFGGGLQDANLADVIFDHLTNALWGVGFQSSWIGNDQLTQTRNYWTAAGFFGSPTIISQESAADSIQKWIDAGNCAAFVSEGVLKVLPYGDTTLVGNGVTYTPQTSPVVDLDDDDFLSQESDDDPIQIVRQPRQDAYNHIRVQYSNRLNSYNAEIVDEYDLDAINKYGQRDESTQGYDFICTLISATFAANIRLRRIQGIREQYKFTISGVRYWYLEPMDLVTLTDPWLGLNKTPVRILEIEENDKGDYEITAEQFPWGTATATLYPKGTNGGNFPTQGQSGPGNINTPIIFQPPNRLSGYDYQLWLGLSGANPNWGGCRVWMSTDGTNYSPVTSTIGANAQTTQCRMGVTTADLPVGSSIDTTHTLSVNVEESGAQLQSVTDTQAQDLLTLCWLGTGEIVGYATATLTGEDAYNLTYLIRGALGSTIVDNPSATSFLRLDDQVFILSFDQSLVGKTLHFKFTSFNLLQANEQTLADVSAYTFTPAEVFPPPPVVTISQSSTSSGAGANTASQGLTTSSSGIAAAAIVYITVAWTWPSNYPATTGFNVVIYEGSDPTNVSTYLAPIATAGPTATSYTFAVAPNASMTNVNAAVEALYA